MAVNIVKLAPVKHNFAEEMLWVHYIYDPYNPSLNAIISVARRLQEVLIETGAITDGQEMPFPALAPTTLP